MEQTKIIRGEDGGACLFYTESGLHEYFFEINGRATTLHTTSSAFIPDVIEEFLFYSGFVDLVLDKFGNVLLERDTTEPYLHKIADIQPSQFFISERKLQSCKKWIKGQGDIFIPVAEVGGKIIALDGHTRMRAALDLGFREVYVYPDDYNDDIFYFVNEAIKRGICGVSQMEILSNEEYAVKWDKFCDDFFKEDKH